MKTLMRFLPLLLFSIPVFSQKLIPIAAGTQRLSYVDSMVVAMKLNNCRDLEILTDTLMVPFTTDSEKVRAIYFWITENISYDCAKFHKMGPEGAGVYPEGKDWDEVEYKLLNDILVKKKGVCQDYADLFQYMCWAAHIPCETLHGYGACGIVSNILVLNDEISNHAWNKVLINGKWYLIDCTWASGYGDVNCTKFTKKRNDLYYLTPPNEFIKDHHPTQKEWQLLDPPMEMKEWVKQAKDHR